MSDAFDKDFEQFMACSVSPAGHVSEIIVAAVKRDLLPSPSRVAVKIHALGLMLGIASLLICPQFGLAYGPLGHTLHGLFMRFGPAACAGLCGALLLSVTTLLVLLCLTRAELRVAYQARHLHSLCLAFLLLGTFLFLGASIVLSLGLVWLAGALIGGISSYRLAALWAHSPGLA